MRRHLISWVLMVVVASGLVGCDNGDTNVDETPEEKIVVVIDSDPGVEDTLCCAKEVVAEISGVAPAGGKYYWAALRYHDTLAIYGWPVHIPAGPFHDVRLGVTVSYLDHMPEGDYSVFVYASDSAKDVGTDHARAIASEAGATEVVSYVDSQCYDCCTGEGDTVYYAGGFDIGLRRYTAFAFKHVTNGIQAEARIETRYGRLCAEGSSAVTTELDAQQNCYVALLEHAREKSYQPRQIQCGWIQKRVKDTVLGVEVVRNDTAVYVEWTYVPDTSTLWVFGRWNGVSVPNNGEAHRYEVCRTYDTIVAARYNYQLLWASTRADWAGWDMKWVAWEGEIAGRETDMPGTLNSPCHFWDCNYADSGDSYLSSAAFVNRLPDDTLDVTPQRGNRLSEWRIDYRYGTGDFWIWDVNPF
jgi:hypothetical protein